MTLPLLAFSYESEMLSLIADYLPAILELKYENHFRVEELYIQGTIPDLLLFSFDDPNLMPNSRRLTATEAHVLRALHRLGEAMVPQIASEIILSDTRMARCIEMLEKRGFISKTCSDCYRVSQSVKERSVEIVAIEMKLRDWRSALGQAISYTAFADRAYVILDGFQVSAEKDILSSYLNEGIGLVFQYGWQLEPVVDARDHEAHSAYRYIAVQKFLERWRMSTSSTKSSIF